MKVEKFVQNRDLLNVVVSGDPKELKNLIKNIESEVLIFKKFSPPELLEFHKDINLEMKKREFVTDSLLKIEFLVNVTETFPEKLVVSEIEFTESLCYIQLDF